MVDAGDSQMRKAWVMQGEWPALRDDGGLLCSAEQCNHWLPSKQGLDFDISPYCICILHSDSN
jgi:hypothetical protein